METISVTELRRDLFQYLKKVASGEAFSIERNHKVIARIIPRQPSDWREKMQEHPEILVSTEELIKPVVT